ncbi:hypothetical protein ACFL1X_01225, partial [Candidatus Hydrogenedentota bacterium]
MCITRNCLAVLVILVLACAFPVSGLAAQEALKFDCGTSGSDVARGYTRLTGNDVYNAGQGYGWESGGQRGVVFKRPTPDSKYTASFPFGPTKVFEDNRNELSQDSVASASDLVFRADVPRGVYRVSVTVGDISQPIGSMDVYFNDTLVGEHVAAWTSGGYRTLEAEGAGYWAIVRDSVRVRDGSIRIALKKNQKYYDARMAEQATWETPYAKWYHKKPVRSKPPYFDIGFPFVQNSVMAIEITPYVPGPVEVKDGQLKLTQDFNSPALKAAIEKYNAKDFAGAMKALEGAAKNKVRAARAVVALCLAGRLETEEEMVLIPPAVDVLRKYVSSRPEEYGLSEILADAELFLKGMDIHLNRGVLGNNHFIENAKALSVFGLLPEDSPLYYKSQLHMGRAAHQLSPYFPMLGTAGEIFKKLDKICPDNRFIKYRLHGPGIFAKDVPGHFGNWEQHGDGADFYDWVMVDYESKVEDAPEWVQALYPAYALLVDLSEWWIKFRQMPDGGLGGGSGDDVEIVGLFGYYGYISRGVSEISTQGSRNLITGIWNHSEVDPELGYCLPLADAEHTAEWTGNTLGMLVQIDYGNPVWIERSMKTGKLLRDLWTDLDKNGNRHFRANFFGAAQIGAGGQTNDSWINYRAIRPANAVLWYNRNPAIAKVYTELAEAWL